MSYDAETLGKLIRTKRRFERLTLRELAAQLGVAYGTLSRVEQGKNAPYARTYVKVKAWLDHGQAKGICHNCGGSGVETHVTIKVAQ